MKTLAKNKYEIRRYTPGFCSGVSNGPEFFTFGTKKELLSCEFITHALDGGDSRLVFSQDTYYDSGRLLIETVSTKERFVLAFPQNDATSRVLKKWFPSRDEERRRKTVVCLKRIYRQSNR